MIDWKNLILAMICIIGLIVVAILLYQNDKKNAKKSYDILDRRGYCVKSVASLDELCDYLNSFNELEWETIDIDTSSLPVFSNLEIDTLNIYSWDDTRNLVLDENGKWIIEPREDSLIIKT